MKTETLPLENYSHTSPTLPAAPKSVKRNEQRGEQYSRWLLVLLVLAGIAVIAYVDWAVRALSLGFLYIFPLAFGGIVMGRRATLLLVPLCVFLVDWLGPYEHAGWHLLWRNLISLAGFLAVVQVVSRLVQQRRRLTETVWQQRDEMAKDIAQAALIQRRMLPQRAPVCDGIELAARMQSAKVVAGDYYDFIEQADGNLGLISAKLRRKFFEFRD
ncbi:MAG: PP2C family protein-serine/threonine phosphatase [Blastocatellia bacterium]